MHLLNKTFKPSLVNQIEIFKNYSEHRQRINLSRYRSITSLKKSMSFNKQQLALHEYIKARRQYTNDFKIKQALKKSQSNDAKMLQKILEYESKNFVFSLRPTASVSDNLLHHNAIVSGYRKTEKIDQQNQKIHFRITRAKSLYTQYQQDKNSRLTNSKITSQDHFSHSTSNNFRSKNKDLSKHRVLTEGQEITATDEDVKQFTNYSKMQSAQQSLLEKNKHNPQVDNLVLPNNNCFKKSDRRNFNQFREFSRTKIRKRVCQRIRNQKLAQRLYQKKSKLISPLVSKLRLKV